MNENAGVSVCIFGSFMLIGRLSMPLGKELLEPRLIRFFETPKKRQEVAPEGEIVWKMLIDGNGDPVMEEKIQLKPLPGLPMKCPVPEGSLVYPVLSEEMNLLALYKTVTKWGKTQPPSPGQRNVVLA